MTLYLNLFHGRSVNPRDLSHTDMEEWGRPGPTFSISGRLQGTYCSDLKMWNAEGSNFHMLHYFEDVLHYDDTFYGDFDVSTIPTNRPVTYRESLASLAPYERRYMLVSDDRYLCIDPGQEDDSDAWEWLPNWQQAYKYTLWQAWEWMMHERYVGNTCHIAKPNGDGTATPVARDATLDAWLQAHFDEEEEIHTFQPGSLAFVICEDEPGVAITPWRYLATTDEYFDDHFCCAGLDWRATSEGVFEPQGDDPRGTLLALGLVESAAMALPMR